MLAAAAAAQTAAAAAAAAQAVQSAAAVTAGINGFSPLSSAATKISEKRKIIEEIALSDVKKVRRLFTILPRDHIFFPVCEIELLIVLSTWPLYYSELSEVLLDNLVGLRLVELKKMQTISNPLSF